MIRTYKVRVLSSTTNNGLRYSIKELAFNTMAKAKIVPHDYSRGTIADQVAKYVDGEVVHYAPLTTDSYIVVTED